ncbi:MAG: ATP-binding protein [Thaumarchaeota archaeon]|nr:ATP-binding protein [Nitrososphaerota archaeon]
MRQETNILDYKLDIDVTSPSFVKIVKDVAAMANGEEESDLVFGVDDDYNQVGFDPNIENDEGDIRTKIGKYLNPPIEILYKEILRKNYLGIDRKFSVLHIFPNEEIALPKQDGKWSEGSKEKVEFRVNDVLVRSGSRSIKAGAFEFNQLIERRFRTRLQESQHFVSAFTRLMSERAKPLPIQETLASNIFHVKKIPENVWRGETDFTTKDAVYRFLANIPVPEPKIPKFILRERRILTFSLLHDGANPLRAAVSSQTIDFVKTLEFLRDRDKSNWIIDLLNSCLRKHCEERNISYHADSGRYYYRMPKGERRLRQKYKLGNRTYPRTVAKYDYTAEEETVIHNAVDFHFTELGSEVFLVVFPGLLFTSDGSHVVSNSFTARRATELLHNQYNQSILKDIRFWVSKIQHPESVIRIKDFGFEILVEANSDHAMMNVGYNDEDDVVETDLVPEEDTQESEPEEDNTN